MSQFSSQGVRPGAQPGTVYLIGAGPGDPELLTLRGMRLLGEADAVVYDNLVSQPILDFSPATAERIYVGKKAANHALPQQDINALLIRLAGEGKRVIRLKGGDPFVFGRGGEECEDLLEAGIPFEVVPGVTAASGISAYAGIPLTHRDHAQAVVFATGYLKDGSIELDWPMLARPRQTVVIYMGITRLGDICERLIAHGLPASTPAAVIRSGTTPSQKVVTSDLGGLQAAVNEAGFKPPALLIVGSVVSLQGRLGWFKPEGDPA
ncbi:uroporphyrinogen-III C-methyltransferase [Cognatazoarcus halotolerans]|uniref:uroporphyrinogen-III C-methyltransferase n=1 Tax=Cognatazoarcus halotolerans TaxID=2686016 RepID=UPI001359D59C|nr:uroporphyrinogen-III C-methyltransferase [Cognatazoarcus halotolerans]MCB1898356.1 uroporphyrinogen-III C-methyltransferase [Rhodocyclaceae bacterium]MCP5310690.1 uroporphyrinogen-III C-methyltransferase [Zoogloeaceae bacterium]